MANRLLLTALGAALAVSSCTKKNQEMPAPAAPTTQSGPGAITGVAQPADALFDVSLTDDVTRQTVAGATVNSQTGAYRLDAITAGTYTLYFDSKNGYVRPRQQRVTVAAAKTTVIPTISVVRSTAAFTVDGTAFVPPFINLSLGFDGKSLPSGGCFSIALGDGPSFLPPSSTYVLFLTMPYAVKVGTYPLNDALTYAIFTDVQAGTFDSRLNPASIPSGGTLTVTAVENTVPFPRSVSGTFSFTGTDAATGAQKTISGTFANATF